MEIDEKQKIIISACLVFILFFGAGKVLLDKKTVRDDQVNGFFDALTNEKSLNYFSKVRNLLKNYNCMEIEVSGNYARNLFYKLNDGKPEATTGCPPQITIKMNDHSVAGLIYGSYNMNGAVFSEMATGNLKIEGVGAGDLLKLV